MAARELNADATTGVRPCPICGGGTARTVCANHPGYQEPATFEVASCRACDTSFASPAGEDLGRLYDLIYSQIDRVPSYERYARYARAVRKVKDPLRHLARAEEAYWAIEQYLAGRGGPQGLRLLDVGSGLGYLTYALARRGYAVRGIDLSEAAVARARRSYGDLFEVADVAAVAAAGGAAFDVVIMNELIEHVTDPAALLATLRQVLAAGGEVVVTTPNKSYYPPDAVWETSLPPVHLWWFTETSLRALAGRLGYRIRFLDFGDFAKTHYRPATGPVAGPARKAPTFDAGGRVRADQAEPWARRVLRTISRETGVTRTVRALQALLAGPAGPGRRSPSLCAILAVDPTPARPPEILEGRPSR